ncbi:hypothetical protein Tco_0016060 [Tanacetum coccineum]
MAKSVDQPVVLARGRDAWLAHRSELVQLNDREELSAPQIKHRMQVLVIAKEFYADVRLQPLVVFKLEIELMLKETPWKGVVCFGKRGSYKFRGKLDPFKVVSLVGTPLLIYTELPSTVLSMVHRTFLVIQSKEVFIHEPLAVSDSVENTH